jgi:ribulose-bisphosphate carboxylase small chain
MKITQGTFSFLPPLTDEEIEAQIRYATGNGWSVSLEHTDDPHPRNTYWTMWAPPLFDLVDPAPFMAELRACREAFPEQYIRAIAYDRTHGRQSIRLMFIVNRPTHEPGFRLDRSEGADRRIGYTTHAYAVDRPAGERYR